MQAVSSRQFVRIEAKDIMLNIVLVEPEIPMNTGNIARTCAATRSRLHLVRPLGFDISDRAVKRAGLDYWHMVDLRVYDSIEDLFHKNEITDLWLATTKAPRDYAQAQFRDGCWLFFGKETAGLPLWFRQAHPDRCLRIPMRPEARSLNLANSVASFSPYIYIGMSIFIDHCAIGLTKNNLQLRQIIASDVCSDFNISINRTDGRAVVRNGCIECILFSLCNSSVSIFGISTDSCSISTCQHRHSISFG